jgi:hypothetical protein
MGDFCNLKLKIAVNAPSPQDVLRDANHNEKNKPITLIGFRPENPK